MTQPIIYMITGPNGAGKTTVAMRLLPNFLSLHEFVNADEIARGLNPLDPAGQSVAAGRLMLQRMDSLIQDGKSFAFETTDASHIFAEKLKQAKTNGYELGLIYLWLPNAEFAKQRVRLRVAQGGHNIPEETIERRYSRGIRNLVTLYFPIMDTVTMMDGALPDILSRNLIARKRNDQWQINQPVIWQNMQSIAQGSTHD